MKQLMAIIAVAAAVSGCAVPPVQTFTFPPFDESEFAALPKTGTGVIRGQVFAKTLGGDVKKGAGENVVLFPATPYGEIRYREQVIGGKMATAPEDPRFLKRVIVKTTDADGRFEFKDVPAGSYYVLSRIIWQVPTYQAYVGTVMEPQGGKVVRRVEVSDGMVVEAMLNYN